MVRIAWYSAGRKKAPHDTINVDISHVESVIVMAYRIAIVDDDPALLERVCLLTDREARKNRWNLTIHRFLCPEEVENLSYDAYLLDISMPCTDGINLALQLRNSGILSPILFVSSVESKVFEAIRAQPLRFVRKARLDEELPEALQVMVRQMQQNSAQILVVNSERNTASIQIRNLLYIECFNKIQRVVTAEQEYRVYSSMEAFTRQLADKGFFRLHRSYLVNLDAIVCVEQKEAVISNGDRLPISRTLVDEVKHQLEKRFFSC